MQIGAQLYTVRDYAKDEAGVRETFRRVAEIGYRTVQVSGLAALPPEVMRSIADENGLAIVVTHSSPDRMLSDPDGVMRDHEILGCRHLGIGSMPGQYAHDLEGIRRFCADFSPVAEKFRQNGFKLHYHNHHFEFERFEGKTGLEWMAEHTPREAFGFILDTYWAQFGGADPAQFVRKFAGRIDVLHLKDMTIEKGAQIMAEVGEGNLNFKEIFKACAETGVPYAMVEQDVCKGCPFDSLAVSYRHLTEWGYR